jgi:hypothetical protein
MTYEDTVVSTTAGLFASVIYLAVYVVMCFLLYKIFTKLKSKNAWLAIVPLVNFLYFIWLGLEKNNKWMIILVVIPFANIVLILFTTHRLLKLMNKNPWALLLFLVPVLGQLALLGYMAY